MPYRTRGQTVYKKTDGLKKVGTAKKGKLKAYLRLLRGVEHGWKPTNRTKALENKRGK